MTYPIRNDRVFLLMSVFFKMKFDPECRAMDLRNDIKDSYVFIDEDIAREFRFTQMTLRRPRGAFIIADVEHVNILVKNWMIT